MLTLRDRYPAWGGRKLHARLDRTRERVQGITELLAGKLAQRDTSLDGELLERADAFTTLIDTALIDQGLIQARPAVDPTAAFASGDLTSTIEVAAASDAQHSGIEQVNRAILQMDQATHHNASLVEQAAAASESLEEQAQALNAVTGIFKLPGASSAPASPTPRIERRKPARPWFGAARPVKAEPAAAGGRVQVCAASAAS